MSVFLDLTEVKQDSFQPTEVKPGKYLVRCIQVEQKETAKKTGSYLSCKFKFLTEAYDKVSFFHMFNIKNESKKAQDIGLSQLKAFLESAGHGPVLESMADLVGLTAYAQIGIETFDGNQRIKVKYFMKDDSSKPTEELFS